MYQSNFVSMSAVDCSALAGFAFFFFWKFHFTITRFFCVLSIAFQSVETFLGLFEDSGIKKKKKKQRHALCGVPGKCQ